MSTYFRPTNAETGSPLLVAYFTAPLFLLADAHLHDVEERTDDLAADVRDHLDRAGIPIRPLIKHGRVRILMDDEPDEDGVIHPAQVFATVMVFFTDAEPGDPRLDRLSGGFHSERIDADVVFEIPTHESEAEIRRQAQVDEDRSREFLATATVERAEKVRESEDPFSKDMSGLFD